MKKLLLTFALMGALASTNVFGVTVDVPVGLGPYYLENKTGADVWFYSKTITGLPGKSAYMHLAPNEKPYLLKDVTVRKIKFRSYICKNGIPTQIEKDYSVETSGSNNWITISISNGKLVITESKKERGLLEHLFGSI